MYHFPTKEALMTAVIDHLLDGYERDLAARLATTNPNVPTISERLAAYVDWACDGPFDYGDLVMFTDPRLRELRVHEPWLDVPDPRRGVLEEAALRAVSALVRVVNA